MSDLTPEQRVQEIRSRQGTHWDGCHAVHDVCFLLAALVAAEKECAVLEKERDHYMAVWAKATVARSAAQARVAGLEKALTEHHAHGVMDGVLVGDVCPVCSRLGLAGSPPPVTPLVRQHEDDGA